MKKFLIVEGESISIYSAKVRDERNNSFVKLFFSKLGNWLPGTRGKLAAAIRDDGNGVDISFGDWGTRFNYAELEYLMIALRLYDQELNGNLKRVIAEVK